jgi:hypothetical protein
VLDSTLSPTGTDLSVHSDFAACLSLYRLGFTANSKGEPSRSVSSNRAFKLLNFFGSTRDVDGVDFAIPVGLFGFDSDVDTIALAFSTTEVF